MGKGKSRVFHDVKAYVSCQDYDGIPVSVRQDRKSKVAPRVSEHSDKLALDRNIGMFLSGAFSFGKNSFYRKRMESIAGAFGKGTVGKRERIFPFPET